MVGDVPDSAVDLARRVTELEAENRRLRQLLGVERRPSSPSAWEPTLFAEPADLARHVDRRSTPQEKVALFRELFQGRNDVYAQPWSNTRTDKSGWSPVVKGGWTNARKPDREYTPLVDEVISDHLGGQFHAGLYWLLRDDSCRLLACDFDGPGWTLDALAYLDAARAAGVRPLWSDPDPAMVATYWVFFADAVPASAARRIGVFLAREAMTARAELDLSSYNRLFPSQNFLPHQGFGNLIALPLQGQCRHHGTTVFLDPVISNPMAISGSFSHRLIG